MLRSSRDHHLDRHLEAPHGGEPIGGVIELVEASDFVRQ